MRNYLIFGRTNIIGDSVDSRDYGVYISGSGVFNSPRRIYETVHVPGRNGDLLFGGESYENIEVTYPCFIYEDFQKNLSDFRNALIAKTGYHMLRDSYSDDVRYGCFMDEIDVDPTATLEAGEFELTFFCKPQRYLAEGQTRYVVNDGEEIFENPTPHDSKPVIYIEGYGDLTITYADGSTFVITVQNVYPEVYIDSELEDCYYGTANANEYVSFNNDPSNKFPLLRPGNNTFSWTDATISRIIVQPRWFVI